MIRVLALDPGGTTGWARFTIMDVADKITSNMFTCGQLGPGEHHADLYAWLEHCHTQNFTLVIERFEYRNQSRAGLDLSSREYIGVAKLFRAQRGVPIIFQNASQGKGFVRDSHIKKLGLWSPNQRHAMDAMRHLLFYLTNSRQVSTVISTKLLRAGWS